MRTQVNVPLNAGELEEIDAAVERKNKGRKPGHPRWSRARYMVAGALFLAEEDKRKAGVDGWEDD